MAAKKMAAGIKLADTWLTVEPDESEAPIKAEKVKVRRPTQDGARCVPTPCSWVRL